MPVYPHLFKTNEEWIKSELVKHFQPIFELAIKEDLDNQGELDFDLNLNQPKSHSHSQSQPFSQLLKYDLTTSSSLTNPLEAVRAQIIAKEDLVVCGYPLLQYIFEQSQTETSFLIEEGKVAKKGDIVTEIKGRIGDILLFERIGLNLFQHLCSIATKVRKWLELITPDTYCLYDTRKTIPGYRYLEKYAVFIGGAYNHRLNLNSSYLIKDNHLKYGGKLSEILKRVHHHRLENNLVDKPVEIECENIKQVKMVIDFVKNNPKSVNIIMLDNFQLDDIGHAVHLIKSTQPDIKVEISGNIDEVKISKLNSLYQQIKSQYQVSFDYISAGGLTQSSKSVDLSLNFI